MLQLAKREEQIMRLFWKLEKAFIKEIVAGLANHKIHYNTAATLIRNLESKGFLKHIEMGNSFQYYPIIEEETYKTALMNSVVDRYFEDSYPDMVAYFAKNERITEKDLRRILELIIKNHD